MQVVEVVVHIPCQEVQEVRVVEVTAVHPHLSMELRDLQI
jgi:hypothetical protein